MRRLVTDHGMRRLDMLDRGVAGACPARADDGAMIRPAGKVASPNRPAHAARVSRRSAGQMAGAWAERRAWGVRPRAELAAPDLAAWVQNAREVKFAAGAILWHASGPRAGQTYRGDRLHVSAVFPVRRPMRLAGPADLGPDQHARRPATDLRGRRDDLPAGATVVRGRAGADDRDRAAAAVGGPRFRSTSSSTPRGRQCRRRFGRQRRPRVGGALPVGGGRKAMCSASRRRALTP